MGNSLFKVCLFSQKLSLTMNLLFDRHYRTTMYIKNVLQKIFVLKALNIKSTITLYTAEVLQSKMSLFLIIH